MEGNGNSLRGRGGACRGAGSAPRPRGRELRHGGGSAGRPGRTRAKAPRNRLQRGGFHGKKGGHERPGLHSGPLLPGIAEPSQGGAFRGPGEFASGVFSRDPEIHRKNTESRDQSGLVRRLPPNRQGCPGRTGSLQSRQQGTHFKRGGTSPGGV